MTNSEDHPVPALQSTSKRRSGLLGLLMVVTMLAALVAGVEIWRITRGDEEPKPIVEKTNVTDNHKELEQRINSLNVQVEQLAVRIAHLEQNQSQPQAAEAAQKPETPNVDVEPLKNDIAKLSSTLDALQTQWKQTSQASANTQASMAQVVAYTQLYAVAMTDEGFAHEYQTMKLAASDTNVLQNDLVLLESVATNGAPTVPMLRDELSSLIAPTQTAMRKAVASTWEDRVMVEVQSLVSVRSLHPEAGEGDPLIAIQMDVARGHLSKALEKIQALPPAAQDVLKDWQHKAEARQTINHALKALGDHMQLVKEP